MKNQVPPIVHAAENLLTAVELAASDFTRRHKYTFGERIRSDAFEVALLAKRAWRERSDVAALVAELAQIFDRFKLRLQLGKRINAFRSFGQFQAIALLSVDLGRQIGGWYKQLHPKRQNSAARPSPPERSPILSTRAAPSHTGATS